MEVKEEKNAHKFILKRLDQKMLGPKIFRSKIFFGPKQFWGKNGPKIHYRTENDIYRYNST